MVSGHRTTNLVADLTLGKHQLRSGVSEKLGGQDEGPNPHELIEGALAACTIITVQMYANRKGYKLESTDVKIKIISEGADTQISREISFRGDLTDEEKVRLLEIADKCPIHRLLESRVKVETTVVE